MDTDPNADSKLDGQQTLIRFIQSAAVSIAMFDTDMNYIAWSRAYTEEFNLADEDLFGRNHYDVMPDLPDKWKAVHRRCLAGASETADEDLYVSNDGKMSWHEWNVRPWYESEHVIGGIVLQRKDVTERKLDKQHLLQFQQIVDDNADYIALLDTQSRYQIVNKAYLNANNKTKEELIGRTPVEIFDRETFENVLKPNALRCMQGETIHTQAWLSFRDGAVRFVDINYTPFYDENGAVSGYITNGRDITNRQKLQEQLDEALLQNKLILESAGAGIYGLDSEGRTTFINPAAEEMLGWIRQDLIGKLQHDVIHHSHRDGSPFPVNECPIYKTFTDGQTYTTSNDFFWRKDGTAFPVEYTVTPIIQDGNNQGAVVIFRDITKKIERQEQYRSIFNQAAVGITRLSLHGDYTDVNDKFCKILGYSKEELLQLNSTELTHPDDRSKDKMMMRKAINGDVDEYTLEKRYIRKNGEYIWVNLTASLIRLNDGQPHNFITIVQDINERKKTEFALQYSEERYRSLVEATTSIIWTTSGDGEFTEPQQSWEKFTGQMWPEYQGMNWKKMIHPDDVDRILREWSNAVKTKRFYKTYGRIWNKQLNEWRNFDVSAVPQIDQNDIVQEWVGFITDTTQSFRLEKKLIYTQELLNKTEQIARIGGWEFDLEREHLTWTDMTYELHELPYDYTPSVDDAIGFYYGESREQIENAFNNLLDAGERFDLELRFKTAKDRLIWVRVIGEPIYQHNEMVSVAGTFEDITARKNYENAVVASEEKYRTLVESSPYSIYQLSDDGKIISMNRAGQQMFNVEKEVDVTGGNFIHYVNSADQNSVQDEINKALSGVHSAFEFQSTNGLDFSSTLVPIYDKDNPSRVDKLLGITLDITESKSAQKQLNYQASHDVLTQLINRREFEHRAIRLLETVSSTGGEHALCFMDLDQFKVVNDTCGHTAGDELLRQISVTLQAVVRKRDTLARLGGDEFGLLLEHCPRSQAIRVAEEILEEVQNFAFSWQGQTFKIGVSIGLVSITRETANLTDLLKNADTACYMAKDRGRNRLYIYKEDDIETSQRQGEMQWVTRIHDALENDRFCLYAQSIEPLNNECKRHYELLIRMFNSQNVMVPPGAFLPAAERYNLVTQLDRWVIDRAFEMLQGKKEFLEQVDHCSINLSGQSLNDPDMLTYIMNKFMRNSLMARKICFEITETSAIANLTQALDFINKLKQFECRFALDDFGSGLSSFAYLKNLPVDYLKIDGMFVRDIGDDPIDHAMVKSINDIGQVMGMKTIAEFVESDMIKGMLKEIGVDYAQGYAVEKPMPFEALLNDSSNIIPMHNQS